MTAWWMVVGSSLTVGVAFHGCRWLRNRQAARRREEILREFAMPGPSHHET